MSLSRRLALLAFVLVARVVAHAQSTVPAVTQALPAQTLSTASAPVTVDLRNYFNVPGLTGQVAQFDTVLGKFNVELLASDAPLSVANFLSYVNDGSYNNTFIHRSTALGSTATSNRIIQGGGYSPPNGDSIARKSAIALEYKLANTRGTLAMARSSALNSATSEWFFNVDDNTTVLGASNNGGYAVFARVLGTGMSVVDAIAAVPTYNVDGGLFATLPLRNVATGQNVINVTNFITITSVTAVPVYPTNNTSPAVLTFTPANNNSAVVAVSISGSTLTLTPVGPGTATISIRAADTNNNFASGTLAVTVAAAVQRPLAIVDQPISAAANTGSTVVFFVSATGPPAPSYRWRKDGVDLAGATSATLVVNNVSAASAGLYTAVATNGTDTVTSNAATLTVVTNSDPGRLTNLSVLTDISGAVPTFTVGTVIGGGGTSGAKPLVVRAAGPALGALGLGGTLSDPRLDFYSGSTVVATNDDWGTPLYSGAATATAMANAMASVGGFAFAPGSKDAAVYNPTVQPGGYTVIVSGAAGASGTTIAELYDATPAGTFTPSTPRLINVSVLKQINVGGSLTLGFTVGGTTARTVLIRAIGPGLAALGINNGTITDPQLTLFDSRSVAIATNNDWNGDPSIAPILTRVNAFSVGSSTKDSMLLRTLQPGQGYTAQVSGVGGAGGLAIVEVYEVP